MNLKTKSEMLFPGREKSGLVTPNSTDCVTPKGLGGPGTDIAVLFNSGVLLQTISRSYMAMGPSVPAVKDQQGLGLGLLAHEWLEI